MNHRRRGRVTYRPGKSAGVFGIVWGGIFVLIGLFVAIPTFGAFGILWTVGAAAITIFNAYQAFGKGYQGPEISFEEDPDAAAAPPEGGAVEQRLQQLRSLYDQRLITQEEYEEKRKEILDQL